ncbi:threonine-phosphate decarboxylase CobD [Methylopila turkensis]|uniref:threonine-phosphate decarboxylase n=1 Tax=Methylopila turkensis TaxID=1437816 RepID=A0A9W6N832_9HYPH|nr:threonine-phosphate decarboxylase CobD [Methylopila turkensis]GLK81133.1 threonine-phosphate decarboxylase [Methylopila turkensis]
MRHGGDLANAEAEYGRPANGWLDLSTGVNPYSYPLAAFSDTSLTRLPQKADVEELLAAARQAYGWSPDVPVVAGPGSQAMIQLLPYLRYRKKVAVIGPTYGEHVYVWARAGHEVREVRAVRAVGETDVVVVVNPNNPTGRLSSPKGLARLASELAPREGLLVIDEAFADVAPDIAYGGRLNGSGVVVLRSFGKFFGLPGIRLGFAAGDEEMISELAAELGPWPVSGPAIEAGRAALADVAWISSMRLRLSVEALKLDEALTDAGFAIIGGTDLFRTARHDRATEIHAALARQGVWTRAFEEHADQIRVGIPGGDEAFARLTAALREAV